MAAYLIFAGAIFDFLDGLAARMLKAYSPLGKQLDSMADLVTFGVAPGSLVLAILNETTLHVNQPAWSPEFVSAQYELQEAPFALISFVSLMIPIAASIRLARFNLMENKSADFLGLPSPACGLFFALMALSLNEITEQQMDASLYQVLFSTPIISLFTISISLLMVSNLPMPSLKISGFSGRGNQKRLTIVAMIVVLLIVGIIVNKIFLTMWFGVPVYIILSLIFYLTSKKKHEIQS